MAYRITNAGCYDYTPKGKRIPATETRATMESAEKRASAQIEAQTADEIKRVSVGGMTIFTAGRAFKMIVEPAN